MNLRQYIESLSPKQLEDYANRCKTTSAYLLVKVKYARCQPRKALREALSKESDGAVSQNEVLVHFGIIQLTT